VDLSTSFSQVSKFEINFWNYLNEKGTGKGLNGAWAEFGPWPWPFGHDGLRNGGAPACWLGLVQWGGRQEWCPAARMTRSASWSPRARRASGMATGDESDGKVRRDARNEL
jgi:hypothetical protein